MGTDAADLRREYVRRTLSEEHIAGDPFEQFDAWFEEALAANLSDANAMTLATATPEGRPSARIVLLKGVDERGFRFYTNYESRKGRELEANPQAAVVFWWPPLERQVRIEGAVEPLPAEISDAYFQSRPRPSKLGAWASPQSQVVTGRAVLEEALEAAQVRYPEEAVPRPPHWGGYRLVPRTVEFWQGRSGRLHDRLRYRRTEDGMWRLERLAP